MKHRLEEVFQRKVLQVDCLQVAWFEEYTLLALTRPFHGLYVLGL